MDDSKPFVLEGDDGKYTLPTNADFKAFKAECESDEGWTVFTENEKEGFKMWTKKTAASDFQVVRLKTHFDKIEPETLYDVLHDHEYRKTWDERMIQGYVVEMLGKGIEIGYYAAKMPIGITNRDFVNMRSWKASPKRGEWIIFNHSVKHKNAPEQKGFVRAVSILTGYYLKKIEGKPGVQFIYYAQSDPKGWIPSWVMNTVGTSVAPKIISLMRDAAGKYADWKAKNEPESKPWLENSFSSKKEKNKKKKADEEARDNTDISADE